MNKTLPLVTFAVGLSLGAWWGLHQAAPLVVTRAVSPFPTPVGAPNVGIDAAALRAIVRDELAIALRGKEDARPPSAQAPKAPTSPETLAKQREAQMEIDTLIAGGVWGNEQRFAFQQKISLLDPDQRDHALQELVTRLNSGALKVETNGPPL